MNLDILTLQVQIDFLAKKGKEIEDAANAKLRQIQELNTQIEQQRGALAYNNMLINAFTDEIKKLQATQTASQ